MRFTRSSNSEGALPLVYWIHGGGMASGSIDDPIYKCLDRMLARNFGVAVMMVDFRNSTTPSSTPDLSPFPGGLNDCYSGLCWVHDHADELGIDRAQVCVAGESGGGNLTIATALKALQEGSQARLLPKGFFAMCPYIAGSWPQEVTHEGALGDSHLDHVNNGLFLSLGGGNAALAYGQDAYDRKDILAWPGYFFSEWLRNVLSGGNSIPELLTILTIPELLTILTIGSIVVGTVYCLSMILLRFEAQDRILLEMIVRWRQAERQ